MKTKKQRQSAFMRVGMVLVCLGVLALMIPSPGALPNPSLVLLPAGIVLYTIGWAQRR